MGEIAIEDNRSSGIWGKMQDGVLVLSENEKITKIGKLYKVGISRNESKL